MIKAGVIGAGRMGRYHVRILASLPDVDLVGIADLDQERASELGHRYNTSAYTDFRKLVERVDVVIIAVPTSRHYEVAKQCLQAGKHVLLEKPMASTVAQATELISLAKQHKLTLNVGHIERFNGAVQELKNIIKNPIYIETRRMGPYSPRIGDCGVIMDLLIHDIDIILNLVDRDVKETSVVGSSVFSDFEDIANLQIKFQNGCMASLTASRVTQQKMRTLAITQQDAFIYLDYTDQDLHIHRQSSSQYVLSRQALRYKQESFIERIFIHKDNPLKIELEHFIACCLGKEEPFVPMENDLRALTIAIEMENLLREKGVTK